MIVHAFLTVEEQQIVVEEAAKRGLPVKVYDLDPSVVCSMDES